VSQIRQINSYLELFGRAGTQVISLGFPNVYFGHRHSPGLPSDSGISSTNQAVGECTNYEAASQWTYRVVTTCRLPLYTMGLGANKGNLKPRHHVYPVEYYSRVDHGYPVFIRGPLLEYHLQERTMMT